MEKEDNYSASSSINGGNFTGLDYNALDHHHHHHHQPQHQQMNPAQNLGESSNTHQMVDYMVPHQHNAVDQQQAMSLSFADVMQFADFGPKLALNQGINSTGAVDDQEEENEGMDSVFFLKFPVLNERLQDHDHDHQALMNMNPHDHHQPVEDQLGHDHHHHQVVPEPGSGNNPVHGLRFANSENLEKLSSHLGNAEGNTAKGKRKRPRSVKTTEEVESQRMTHIAVERNRRKQMNEHLRVLRSLMPGSYVQRGDQASIIGGAIEFVRELEQLLQCLESQKRRRLYGETGGPPPKPGDGSSSSVPVPQAPPFFPPLPNDQLKLVDLETELQEETAESKSCLADVEVKLVGFDALIKVLSRRRQGQLIRAIAALEDMQLSILHTNVTTIEQTVLYSFNVKIDGEARFSAEDIANSVQQIFTFIHAST